MSILDSNKMATTQDTSGDRPQIKVDIFPQSPSLSPTVRGVTVQVEDKIEPFLLRNDSFGSNSGGMTQ